MSHLDKQKLIFAINGLTNTYGIDERDVILNCLTSFNKNAYSITGYQVPELGKEMYRKDLNELKENLFKKYVPRIKENSHNFVDLLLNDLYSFYQPQLTQGYEIYMTTGNSFYGGNGKPRGPPGLVGAPSGAPMGLGALLTGRNVPDMVKKSLDEAEARQNTDLTPAQIENEKVKRKEAIADKKAEEEGIQRKKYDDFMKLADHVFSKEELIEKRKLQLKFEKVELASVKFRVVQGHANKDEIKVDLLNQIKNKLKGKRIAPTPSVRARPVAGKPPGLAYSEISFNGIKRTLLDNILGSPDEDQKKISENLDELKDVVENYLGRMGNNGAVERLNRRIPVFINAINKGKIDLWRFNYLYMKYLLQISEPTNVAKLSQSQFELLKELLANFYSFDDIVFKND